MGNCPFCNKQIQDDAVECPHCQRDLHSNSIPPNSIQVASKSKLADSSILFGIMGMLSFILGPIAVILGLMAIISGIVALVRIKKSNMEISGLRSAYIGLVLGVLAIGLTVFYKLPGYMKYQQYSKQAQAKAGLEQIYFREIEYFHKNNSYTGSTEIIDWHPGPDDTYVYFIGKDSIRGGEAKDCEIPKDILSYADTNGFQAVAVGNIDRDPTLDVWRINENKEIKNIVNDRLE